MNCIAIYRAERFSPNSADRDRAIMEAAATRTGCSAMIKEEDIMRHAALIKGADTVLSMARGNEALALLAEAECHATVINRASAVAKCSRSFIDNAMRRNKIPAAPLYSDGGWWIKRGDEAAQSKDDVVFAADSTEKDRIVKEFRQRGISDIVATAHVDGDLVKFYGVEGTGFFHFHYPTDGSFSKFGNEVRNGKAKHTRFAADDLQRDAARLAAITGISVYGGDCIVRPDGSYAIIDFNDWPSFSSCREEAAEAIARLARKTTTRNGYI